MIALFSTTHQTISNRHMSNMPTIATTVSPQAACYSTAHTASSPISWSDGHDTCEIISSLHTITIITNMQTHLHASPNRHTAQIHSQKYTCAVTVIIANYYFNYFTTINNKTKHVHETSSQCFFSFKYHFSFSFTLTFSFSLSLQFWFYFYFRFASTDAGITTAGMYTINQLVRTY